MPDYIRAFAALIMILAMLAGLGFALRRLASYRRSGSSEQDFHLIAGKALDSKRRLAMIRWGDSEYLLCLGPGGDCVIDKRPATISSDNNIDHDGGEI